MMRRNRIFLTLAVLAAMVVPLSANASARHGPHDRGPVQNHAVLNGFAPPTRQYAQNNARKITASRAKAIAQSRYKGYKFVNVQMENKNTYRVRLQKNGRVIDVYVDAFSGQVKD